MDEAKSIVGYRLPDMTRVLVSNPKAGVASELPLRLDLWNHSPTGFEWGYLGSGPAQLALAILAYVTGDDAYARARHQQFKTEVVAPIQDISWELSFSMIREWVEAHPLSLDEAFPFLSLREQGIIIDRRIAEEHLCGECGGKCRFECNAEEGEPYRAWAVCTQCGDRMEF